MAETREHAANRIRAGELVRGERVREHAYTHNGVTYGVRLERMAVESACVNLHFTATPISGRCTDPLRLRLSLRGARPADAHLLRAMDETIAEIVDNELPAPRERL